MKDAAARLTPLGVMVLALLREGDPVRPAMAAEAAK